jgi:hypothetical protein
MQLVWDREIATAPPYSRQGVARKNYADLDVGLLFAILIDL